MRWTGGSGGSGLAQLELLWRDSSWRASWPPDIHFPSENSGDIRYFEQKGHVLLEIPRYSCVFRTEGADAAAPKSGRRAGRMTAISRPKSAPQQAAATHAPVPHPPRTPRRRRAPAPP